MNKSIRKSAGKELFMPVEVSIRYKQYCEITKLNFTEQLRVLILTCVVKKMTDTKYLNSIIDKTKNRNKYEDCIRYCIRLPQETVEVLNKYYKVFHLYGSKGYFLYFLIEEELKKVLEDQAVINGSDRTGHEE